MSSALVGGIMIGLSALILYGALGKIAGISGIAFAATDADGRGWRLPFLLGLIGGAWIAVLSGVELPLAPLPGGRAGIMLTILAGILVGAGTRLGNGCTSGHGICGLARLSRRSLVAVLVFMSAGMLTATFLRQALL